MSDISGIITTGNVGGECVFLAAVLGDWATDDNGVGSFGVAVSFILNSLGGAFWCFFSIVCRPMCGSFRRVSNGIDRDIDDDLS